MRSHFRDEFTSPEVMRVKNVKRNVLWGLISIKEG